MLEYRRPDRKPVELGRDGIQEADFAGVALFPYGHGGPG